MNRKILTTLLLFFFILATSDGDGKDLNAELVANFEAGVEKIINPNLYDMDQQQANNTLQEQVKVGQTTIWTNPNNGHAAPYSPTDARPATGENCTYFESNVMMDGREEMAWGQACHQANGAWKIVK
jgi:surface antigen